MHRLITEYRALCCEIVTIESEIKSKERELHRLGNVYRPAGSKGMDYTSPQVQASRHTPDIVEIAGKIYEISDELATLREELSAAKDQRRALEDVARDMGSVQSHICLLKAKGLTNRQIAREVGYSKRHVERLVSEINKKLAGNENMSVL